MKINKRTLLEICLILIVISESVVIFYLLDKKDKVNISEASENFIYQLSCENLLYEFLEYYDSKDFDKIISYGKHLINNGFENDKFVLYSMAWAYYGKGEKELALKYLQNSINGEEYCNKTGIKMHSIVADAEAHYHLGELLLEAGRNIEAEAHFKTAIQMAKDEIGDCWDEARFIENCKKGSFLNIEIKHNNASSPDSGHSAARTR